VRPLSYCSAAAQAGVLLVVALARQALAAPGDLDTSFGEGGTVVTDVASSNSEGAAAVVVQADGKIIAAGSSEVYIAAPPFKPNDDFAVVRYDADGALDPSFGGTGKITTDIEPLGTGSIDDQARAMALQADGKIVVVGVTQTPFASGNDFALVRYDPDGTLDSSFGLAGKVVTDLGSSYDEANAVVVQTDGKIVAAGISDDGGRTFAVARYNPDGTLDVSFGGTGVVRTAIGGVALAQAVALQADGKIVVAGRSDSGGLPGSDFTVVRYEADGTLDTTFGGTGVVAIAAASPGTFQDGAYSVAVQADGKIVAAGRGGGDFAVMRWNPDGTLDASFGGTGTVYTPVGPFDDWATSLAVQPDGKIVAAGHSDGVGASVVAVVRHNPDGTLDTSFGGRGSITTPIAFGASAEAVTVQPDGKIVAAGRADVISRYRSDDFALVRYERGLVLTCPATPVPTCLAAGKGSLQVKESVAGKEKLGAKLSRLPALAQSDFGDPLTYGGTAYTACFYDATGALAGGLGVDRAALLCAGRPCWKALPGRGFLYRDKGASLGGVKVIKLLGGAAEKSQIAITAANTSSKGQTSLPIGIAAALAGSSGATVQVIGTDAPQCFAVTLTTVLRNAPDLFKARR
jgi:uncharacterized delta-60 repeat protein